MFKHKTRATHPVFIYNKNSELRQERIENVDIFKHLKWTRKK